MIPLLFAIHDAITVPTWAPLQKRGKKENKHSTITNESFMGHFYTFLQHIYLKHMWIWLFLHSFICQISTVDKLLLVLLTLLIT